MAVSDGLSGAGESGESSPEVASQFRQAMEQESIVTQNEIIADGRLHRFHVEGDKAGRKNGWYVLHPDPYPVGTFGAWNRDGRHTWMRPLPKSLSREDRAALKQSRIEAAAKLEAEIATNQAKARVRAEYIWNHAASAPVDHPYLVKKHISSNGARLYRRLVVLPVRDVDGALHSLQFITASGEKSFLSGGRVSGCWCPLEGVGQRICVAEGFATGATVHEVTGEAVAVAFNAGNLKPVALALRRKYPRVELVIAADHDAWTPGNPGLSKAKSAAWAVRGRVAVPQFHETTNRPTDFNDLLVLEGAEAVKRQLEGASAPNRLAANPWAAAQDVTSFLCERDEPVEFFERPILAREHVTEFFSPRGLGKSERATELAVRQARAGRRVLYLDRDNSPRATRERFRAWGAEGLTTLKVLMRDKIPPLTRPDEWAIFPWADYDIVIVDSLDSHAEGVGEQDSGKPSRAIAPLLDIAHRDGGPAVLVLGNCVRSAQHSRGSGVVEDRGDFVFEVRDITAWTPTGNKSWWEELPPADAGSWAARASRRKERSKIRLAFIATKYRGLEEPEPWAVEIDFSADPRSIREVTDEIDRAGAEEREVRRRAQEETERQAVEALEVDIRRRAQGGEPPMRKEQDAVPFLMRCGVKRGRARDLLVAGHGKRWNLTAEKGKHGRSVTVILVGSDREGGEKGTTPEASKTEGVTDPISRQPHEQATARNDRDETIVSKGFDNSPFVAADPKQSAGELPFEGADANDGEVEL